MKKNLAFWRMVPLSILLVFFMSSIKAQCNRASDSLQLVSLYNATNGANWTNKWVLTQPMTTWYGVTLNASGCVTCIDLDGNPSCDNIFSNEGNNLIGAIPNLSLNSLQNLFLTSNQLNGAIPNFNLPNLQNLNLDSNQLNNIIPNFNLPNLQSLNLNSNQLSGSIPNFNLPNLKMLSFGYNQLSGSIPNFNLSNLQKLYLDSNKLSGMIPNFNLPNLQSLILNSNQLSGTIPDFNLPNLQSLGLYSNQLSGTIPDFNLPNLQSLGLNSNQLSGTIPNFNLPNLQYLILSSNQLNGTIPNFNLPNLVQLLLNHNQISGTIPNFNLPKIRWLFINNNKLTGTIPSLNLPTLKWVMFNDNNLLGCIPPEIKTNCPLISGISPPLFSGGNISNNPSLATQSWANYWNNGEGACLDCTSATASITGKTSICGTNAITLNATTNLIAPTYAWSTGATTASITVSTAATYSVTITQSDGCTKTASVVVGADNSCRCSDSLQLVSLYNSTNGANWTNKWVLTQPMTTWFGVTLNAEGCVIQVRLSNNKLIGKLPNLNLPQLEWLSLPDNLLSDTIPNFNLSKLQFLMLYGNQFTGTIPNFNLPQIFSIYLYGNKLTGNIPNFSLPNLNSLFLYDNQLTGIIPNFNLPKLEYLYLYNNRLMGKIPYFNSPRLGYIYLENNLLTDTIPNFDYVFLRSLRLFNNSLSGRIPKFNLPQLSGLLLNNNQLEGCIPQEIKRNSPFLRNDGGNISNNPNLATQSWTNYWNNNEGACSLVDTTSCRYKDSLQLVALYNATNGANWLNKTNWLTTNPINTWYGITVNTEGCIIKIDLSGDSLHGNIPNFNLPNLQNLTLYNNQLSNSIPNFNLPNLKSLFLYNNQLSGSIPNFNLPSLQDLYLANNQLSGSIPNFNLFNLQNVDLSFNQLSGNISNFTLPNLKSLYLNNNQLNGSIPNFTLPNLQNLWLSSNQLSGTIPNFNLPNLQTLSLSSNQLSGTIPNFNLSSLKYLRLDTNKLTGCIPREIKINCVLIGSAIATNSTSSGGNISNNPSLTTQNWANYWNNNEGTCLACTSVTVSISGDSIVCNDGSSNVVLAAATNALFPTYLWSTGDTTKSITVSSPAIYRVTVSQSDGCKQSVSKNVSFTTTSLPSVTSPVYYCQSATALPLTATGSNLLWYTTASGGVGRTTLIPNTGTIGTISYYVSQTVNGCESRRNIVSVTVRATPSVILVPTAPTCNQNNGSIKANTTNGTPPYNYRWSNGATTATISSLAAGNYSMTMTDAIGCTQFQTMPLVCVPTACTNVTITRNATVCEDEIFILPKGDTAKTSGTYRDTFKISTCDSIIITNLTVNPSVTNNVSVSINQGQTYTLPSGVVVSASGTYRSVLTRTNGCDSIIYTNLTVDLATTCFKRDSFSLAAFNLATNPTGWRNKWDLTRPLDTTWYGIYCTNTEGCISSLDLDGSIAIPCGGDADSGNGLSAAAYPPSLFELSGLELLYLSGNKIGAFLPPSIGRLPKLRELQLTGCGLTTLSDSVWTLQNLEGLVLNNNPLNRTLPANISGLRKIKRLHFNSCGLTGAMPQELTALTGLSFIDIENNKIDSFPNLSALPVLSQDAYFDLKRNRLTFDDILPNIRFFRPNDPVYGYAPQDSIFSTTTYNKTVGESLSISLNIDAAITTNVYKWYKNGVLFRTITGNNTLTFSSLVAADAGMYTCEVTNPNVPNLTLYSRKATVIISNQPCTATIGTGANRRLSIDSIPCNGGTSPSINFAFANGVSPLSFKIDTFTSSSPIFINKIKAGQHTAILIDGQGCRDTLIFTLGQPNPIVINPPTVVNPRCNTDRTGSLTLTSYNGGTPPFSFLWSNGATTTSITNLLSGSYTVTMTDSKGCKDSLRTTISGNLVPTTSTLSPSICSGQTYTLPNGQTVSPTNNTTYRDTIRTSGGCDSLIRIVNLAVSPLVAPIVGTIIQPTCTVSTGSVVLNGLPATGTWILTRNPDGVTTSGNGISSTITALAVGTYTFRVTNTAGCLSSASTNIVINAAPNTPTPPSVGTITQPTCTISTGNVVLNGLPATGTWTLTRNPDGVTTSGNGISSTITALAVGNYTYTVKNTAGCSSSASTNIVISSVNATAPIVSTIIQPSCTVDTSRLILIGLPTTGTWTLTRNPGAITTTGTGASTTITGLSAGTYTYSVTNAATCVSPASTNIIINARPTKPETPSVEKQTQSLCDTATGSVVLNGLPATGTWKINPNGITGTGTSTTINGLSAGAYNYIVTNTAGCASPELKVVITCVDNQPETCLDELIDNIPNGFTPGNNGTNDLFDPQNFLNVSGCSKGTTAEELHIFNRWGEMIFKAQPYTKWDGRSNKEQKIVPTGVYYFIFVVSVNGERKSIKGTLNLFAD